MSLVVGADCVVRNDNGEVLLLKREDFRVWTIPGGGGEPGELPGQTAARETLEETGVEVEIDDLIALYTFGPANALLFLYSAHPVGGSIHTSFESVDVRYFAPDALPGRMFDFQRQRLMDGLNGAQGVYRYQALPAWMKIALPPLLGLRRLRNRLVGRPEAPPVYYEVIVQGVLAANGSGERVISVAPEPPQPVWDTLRAAAAREIGRPVEVARLLDVRPVGDAITVRFALREKD